MNRFEACYVFGSNKKKYDWGVKGNKKSYQELSGTTIANQQEMVSPKAKTA
ncbi:MULTISPECIES: hypothetical protein [Bacillus cereus group]|uniref:hypothetical protein n=1 Tax=Bacillus cereus group TaxID=86661 RepID=UPI001F5B3E84|nr:MULTISPECIES: hypothetical protein [Bacillus cereus group]